MRTRVDVGGNVAAFLKGEATAIARGITDRVNRAGIGLRDEYRAQVSAAGLGAGLTKAWRSETYPKGKPAAGAAALVYSKAPVIHSAFSADTVIVAGKGFLVIPTAQAIAMGLGKAEESRGSLGRFSSGSGKSGGQLGAAMAKLGAENLDRLPLPRGRLLIVYRPPKGKRVRGFRRGQKTEAGRDKGVPLFILVRQVRLKQRLDLEGPAERWLGWLYAQVAEVVARGGEASPAAWRDDP